MNLTAEIMTERPNINVSLMRSKIKNRHLDAAVNKVNEKRNTENVGILFTKSELITDCILDAFQRVLIEKGLTVEQISEVLETE